MKMESWLSPTNTELGWFPYWSSITGIGGHSLHPDFPALSLPPQASKPWPEDDAYKPAGQWL